MEILETIAPLVGIGLCVLAGLQLALWSAQSIGIHVSDHRQFAELQRRFRQRVKESAGHDSEIVRWRGFRNFRVERLEKETANCTSVYLAPEDGKPIPVFRPGQHLTFRFNIPGQNKPIVRCYSLSDGPGKPYYRISVKQVPPPFDKPDLPPGKTSTYINCELEIGDRVEVKAPSGSFFLNEDSQKPVVLLAGGVGITPMISMIDRLMQQQSTRMVLLAYGINDGSDHAFKSDLERTAQQTANVNLLNCYSKAQANDRLGVDYHVDGFVSVDVLRQVLPHNDCEFYMCGPPPFMNSLFKGLIEWGVEEDEIRFETFGPASIGKTKKEEPETVEAIEVVPIKFANSDVIANWDASCGSLLELAEAIDVAIDSGCRAGSCGTCSTGLVSGSVVYPDGQEPDCEPGHCLVCIARPQGPCELEA